MKKISAVMGFILALCLIAGCGNHSGNPKTVLIAFFDALSKKDIGTAKKLATADSKELLDLIGSGMKTDRDNASSFDYDHSKMVMGEPIIEGDKATVAVKEKESDETVNFTLKKEEGDWKVAFSKASLVEMAADKVKGKMGGLDSLPGSEDALKKINLDSMKAGINKSLEALDSAKSLLKSIK